MRCASLILFAAAMIGPYAHGAEPAPTCGLELRVEPTNVTVTSNGRVTVAGKWRVSIRNGGTSTLTLVDAGDGSDVGWRTPIVRWLPESTHSKLPRCGNINALAPSEVFELKPGNSRELAIGWAPLMVDHPGKHEVRLRYENDPNLVWDGLPLGEHDEDAMKRVRGSSRCAVLSNPVVVTVEYRSGERPRDAATRQRPTPSREDATATAGVSAIEQVVGVWAPYLKIDGASTETLRGYLTITPDGSYTTLTEMTFSGHTVIAERGTVAILDGRVRLQPTSRSFASGRAHPTPLSSRDLVLEGDVLSVIDGNTQPAKRLVLHGPGDDAFGWARIF